MQVKWLGIISKSLPTKKRPMTDQLYSFGTVQNSLLFAAGGVMGVCTAFSIGYVSLRCHIADRAMILSTQCTVGVVLALFVWLFGCRQSNDPVPPVWELWTLYTIYYIPFIGQMPANNSIYSKLVGRRGVGAYQVFCPRIPSGGMHMPHRKPLTFLCVPWQAILEMSKAIARALAGYIIGYAYAGGGPCFLWFLTLGIWMLQFGPFLGNWSRLRVEDSTYMEGLEEKLLKISQSEQANLDSISEEGA